jgi:biotin transport system permease protein/energy-coupling factor transport system permease protein
MAELNLFHFTPRRSPLHRLDPRGKSLLMLLTVLFALSGSPLQLAGLSCYLLVLLIIGRVALWRFTRELWVFALLTLLIALPHALGGDPAAGVERGWRFLAVVVGGLLYTATTPPRELHGTVQWLLRPVPGVREGAVATHISLALLFIPLMLDTLAEVREARKARFAEGIRNPVLRIRGLAAPLLEKLLQQIEEVSCALEGRCYREDASRVTLRLDPRGWGRLIGFSLPFLLLGLVHRGGERILFHFPL